MGFGVVLSLVLVAELGVALGAGRAPGSFAGRSTSSVAAIGRTLFTEYQFAFEVTSILILVAMVGAVVLAKKESR
jgi:NADH-quinone oxidoreductase subunit J